MLSVVTYGELIYGVERANFASKRESNEPNGGVLIMDLPLQAGAFYGAIRPSLEARGEIVGNNDSWIAAHAKAAGLTLVTNNECEFRPILGLKVQSRVE